MSRIRGKEKRRQDRRRVGATSTEKRRVNFSVNHLFVKDPRRRHGPCYRESVPRPTSRGWTGRYLSRDTDDRFPSRLRSRTRGLWGLRGHGVKEETLTNSIDVESVRGVRGLQNFFSEVDYFTWYVYLSGKEKFVLYIPSQRVSPRRVSNGTFVRVPPGPTHRLPRPPYGQSTGVPTLPSFRSYSEPD